MWSTNNSGLATISSSGVLTGVAAGDVKVRADFGGQTAYAFVTVTGGTPPPPPSGATVIYVSPSGVDTNPGTSTSPVGTIQRGVALARTYNANGQATHVLVAAGIYRESLVIDTGTPYTDAAMTIEGAPGTVLSGADLWNSGWTSVGNNTYTHAWPYRWGAKPIPNGWSYYWTADGKGAIRDRLRRSEMVYVNDQAYHNRLSAAELVPGTFYVDEANSTIRVMLATSQTLPISNYTVEAAVRLPVLNINGRRNVTIKNLTIEKGRGAVQDTMAGALNTTNLVLDGVVVRLAASAAWGSAYNSGLTIRNSSFVDNGITGLSAQRDKFSVLDDSLIARNNWRGIAAEHQGFDTVFKWGAMRDATVRRTQFVDNWGNGFWLDYDNQRITADRIFVARNIGGAVSMEKNPGPIAISNSKFCNNTSGIEDGHSNYVTLTNNQVFNNAGIQLMFTGSPTAEGIPDWETGVVRTIGGASNHVYTGNIFYGSGPMGSGPYQGQWLVWGPLTTAYYDIFRPTIRSDNNTWYHANRTNAFALDGLDGGSMNFWTGTYESAARTGSLESLVESEQSSQRGQLPVGPSGPLSCTP